MAICFVKMSSVTRSSNMSAVAKWDYVARSGRYAKGAAELVEVCSRNMPAWARDAPRLFWQAVDQFERKNARLCIELKLALPRELSWEDRGELVQGFIQEWIPEQPVTYALHRGKETNPHVHIVFSERWAAEFQPEVFFKRNGSKKNKALNDIGWIKNTRECWAHAVNRSLEKAERSERITHLSRSAQAELHAQQAIEAGEQGKDRLCLANIEALKRLESQPVNSQIRIAGRLVDVIAREPKPLRASLLLDDLAKKLVSGALKWADGLRRKAERALAPWVIKCFKMGRDYINVDRSRVAEAGAFGAKFDWVLGSWCIPKSCEGREELLARFPVQSDERLFELRQQVIRRREIEQSRSKVRESATAVAQQPRSQAGDVSDRLETDYSGGVSGGPERLQERSDGSHDVQSARMASEASQSRQEASECHQVCGHMYRASDSAQETSQDVPGPNTEPEEARRRQETQEKAVVQRPDDQERARELAEKQRDEYEMREKSDALSRLGRFMGIGADERAADIERRAEEHLEAIRRKRREQQEQKRIEEQSRQKRLKDEAYVKQARDQNRPVMVLPPEGSHNAGVFVLVRDLDSARAIRDAFGCTCVVSHEYDRMEAYAEVVVLRRNPAAKIVIAAESGHALEVGQKADILKVSQALDAKVMRPDLSKAERDQGLSSWGHMRVSRGAENTKLAMQRTLKVAKKPSQKDKEKLRAKERSNSKGQGFGMEM